MTYRGHVKNGTITLDESVTLPEGSAVKIELVSEEAAEETVFDRLRKFAGIADGLPKDLAKNHDHYLYGTPKKP